MRKISFPKYFKNTALILTAMACIAACSKRFDMLQNDPNNPSEGSPSLELTYIIQSVFYGGDPTGWGAASQQLFYTERREIDQYWGWHQDTYDWFDIIRQINILDEDAHKTNADGFIPIAHFLRQLAFYEQTRSLGDIPYSEAMKAKEGNIKPIYDNQKDIFIGILNELKSANDRFNSLPANATISGDLLYDGSFSKWQKLLNSYRLKILMDLSIHENDGDIGVKSKFNEIISNPSDNPIFESNDDMPQFQFFDQEGNQYPTYNHTTARVQQKLTTTVVNYLTGNEDPRIFRFAEPAWPENSSNWDNAQKEAYRELFTAYKGLEPDLVHGEGSRIKDQVSNLNWRYYEDPTPEPYIKFSYTELQFIIAEAILRDWTNGNAQQHFEDGISASMDFFNADKMGYVAPVLSANVQTAIEQVNMEKFIGFFMNSSWEAWYNHRRMAAHELGPGGQGIPGFKIGPSHFVTSPPIRWEYPQSEIETNEKNVKEAINRQFDGENGLYGVMWLLKK